ncbi:hypothetical protein [Arthrobacter sp. TMN-50]
MQADFRAALELTGANPELSAELAVALQSVLDAQAALDALVDASTVDIAAAQLDLDAALQETSMLRWWCCSTPVSTLTMPQLPSMLRWLSRPT